MDHSFIEKRLAVMIILIIIVISFAGLTEIVPLFYQKEVRQAIASLTPLTPLQLEGRDIYIREGCYTCHTQMVRPLRAETERYGHYSVAGENVYNHPFQWGSKRTGPDLARVGGKYSDQWQRVHLMNPRNVVPESIMPAYPWLEKEKLTGKYIEAKMRALRSVGVPYTDEQIQQAKQAVKGKTELDALVAYLQQLGIHMKHKR